MIVARHRVQQILSLVLVGASLLLGFAVAGWGREPAGPGDEVTSTFAQRAASRRETAHRATQAAPVPSRNRTSNTVARPAGFVSGPQGMPGYVPRHERLTGSTYFQEPMNEPVVESYESEGEIIYQGDDYIEEDHFGGPSCGDCGSCYQCCFLPCLPFNPDNLSASGGVFGTTGPRSFAGTGSRTGSASFGFIEGVNWGAPVPCFGGLGMQFGMNATQSNLSGAQFTDERHRQIFVTGGVFRRVDCGLQAGLVLDYLNDEWYSTLNLTQLRGEVSWVYPGTHELGFWFTASTNGSHSTSVTGPVLTAPSRIEESWEATDLYAFFYRYRDPCTGGNGRLFAGFTGQSDGLIGADFELPVSDTIAIRSAFTYLVPDEGRSLGGPQQESWNIGLNVVWRPCGRRGGCADYYRPLFNVADNGSFLLDRK